MKVFTTNWYLYKTHFNTESSQPMRKERNKYYVRSKRKFSSKNEGRLPNYGL